MDLMKVKSILGVYFDLVIFLFEKKLKMVVNDDWNLDFVIL